MRAFLFAFWLHVKPINLNKHDDDEVAGKRVHVLLVCFGFGFECAALIRILIRTVC